MSKIEYDLNYELILHIESIKCKKEAEKGKIQRTKDIGDNNRNQTETLNSIITSVPLHKTICMLLSFSQVVFKLKDVMFQLFIFRIWFFHRFLFPEDNVTHFRLHILSKFTWPIINLIRRGRSEHSARQVSKSKCLKQRKIAIWETVYIACIHIQENQ